jgi:hypothetical protein
VEQEHLKPIPLTPYDLTVWKKAKVYRDGYVTFDSAFYSVPHRLYPGHVWIGGGSKQVRIFNLKYKLEATHDRARRPGERLTNPAHLPPEKLPGWQLDPDHCLVEALEIGPATLKIVQTLLEDPILYRLPVAGRLVRLRKRFGDERLEAACERALAYDDPSYMTIKRILVQGLEQEPQALRIALPPATTFARSPEELVGELMEVSSWN